ncbi:MAG: TetR/AcrR family transcriptional regulator [Gammaproteobacteria bacterium]|nr:TetR/AcrR family transcriptional regulator [Gammaproteobacteria bacterium]
MPSRSRMSGAGHGPRRRPNQRSRVTRTTLIRTAERLFAGRGIAAVSLNEISKAAGQRNSNACQYHFGDKQGLLQAILDKHVPGIADERAVLLRRRDRSRTGHGLRELVQVFVRPLAARLQSDDGGPEFIRINAQLIALHALAVAGIPASPLRVASADPFFRQLRRALRATGLPATLVQQRLMLAAVLIFHGLDDHARMFDSCGRQREAATRLFTANLEDSVVALLTAPASAAARAACRP